MSVMPRNLRAALFRGEYMKADSNFKFAPLDAKGLRLAQENWDYIRQKLAGSVISQYDIFSDLHFNHAKFETYLKRRGLDRVWPRAKKSACRRLDKNVWESMSNAGHDVEELHQLYKTMAMPRLNLACDADRRNRVLLGALSTISSRNAPGNDDRGTYVFSAPKWARFLIVPPKGCALFYFDWMAQEYGIGAILSGDKNMLRSYESGDPYMTFATMAGAAPSGATKQTHPSVRKLYKVVALAIGYGQEIHGFAARARVPLHVAKRLFADYRRLYHRYLYWREKQVDDFSVRLRMTTKLGWPLYHGARTAKNTLFNFPAQATGAGMLQISIVKMMQGGVEVCCPVHDAILGQARVENVREAVAKAGAAMDYASAALLDGYVLKREVKVIRHPNRFADRDGKSMWNRIAPLLRELRSQEQGKMEAL